MTWFKNGRKYWKHNGRIYSCKAKKRTSSSSSFISYTGTKKERSEKYNSFWNKYSENELNNMGFFSNEESYKNYKNNSQYGKPWWLD